METQNAAPAATPAPVPAATTVIPVPAAAPAATPAETKEASEGKEAIYEMIGDYVKDKTGKRIGKTGGQEIFNMAVEQFFALVTKEGQGRLNGGFGSFHVRDYQAGTRRLPSGQETTFGERKKLRYEEGVVVKALVANGGNLEEALKVRGTRTPAPVEGTTAAPAPVAAAPKATKTAPKTATAPPKAAAAPASTPAKTDGDIDLE